MKQGRLEQKGPALNQNANNATGTHKDTAAALENELRKFKVLYNLAVAMTGDNSLDENLCLVVEQSRHLLNADAAFLALAEKKSGRIRMHTLSGISSPGFKDLEVAIGRGMGGRVLQTLQGVIVKDYLSDSDILHRYDDVVKAEGLKSGMAVPLQVGARNLGVLYAVSYTHLTLPTN